MSAGVALIVRWTSILSAICPILSPTPEAAGRFGHRDKEDEVRDDVPMTRWLALLVAATTLALASPAQASPAGSDTDASFLDALAKTDITVKSQTGAVKAAKSACAMMQQGRPELDVIQLVTRQNPGLDTTRAAQFTAIAASAYCPQFLQRAEQPPAPSPAEPPTG